RVFSRIDLGAQEPGRHSGALQRQAPSLRGPVGRSDYRWIVKPDRDAALLGGHLVSVAEGPRLLASGRAAQFEPAHIMVWVGGADELRTSRRHPNARLCASAEGRRK